MLCQDDGTCLRGLSSHLPSYKRIPSADEGFELLDAPVKRVASKDSPIAYASTLEDEILVQTQWIVDAINETMEF